MNPCIDCHALMFHEAAKLLKSLELPGFLFSGEVLGERPMSQNRQSLANGRERIRHPGHDPAAPECKAACRRPSPSWMAWLTATMLLDIQGRSRKPQLALAKKWGITNFPNPGGGCLLTDPPFSQRPA